MTPFELKRELSEMVILWDTREQNTQRAQLRMCRVGVPVERIALPFGDYSARCPSLDLRDKVTIERKMSLAELAHCFCQERRRFKAEFERAKAAGAKIYLLIENGDIDAVYQGNYRSKVAPTSFVASIFAWLARYDCQLIFCGEDMTGKVIHDILYRELKERLEKMGNEEGE